MGGREAVACSVIEQSRQQATLRRPGSFSFGLQVGLEPCLYLIPASLIDDGLVLSWVGGLLMRDLAQVNAVLKHSIESAPRIDDSA